MLIGTPSGADREKAGDLVLPVAAAITRVLKDPKPSRGLGGFGDNALTPALPLLLLTSIGTGVEIHQQVWYKISHRLTRRVFLSLPVMSRRYQPFAGGGVQLGATATIRVVLSFVSPFSSPHPEGAGGD